MNKLFNVSIARSSEEAQANNKAWKEQFEALTSRVRGIGANSFFEPAWPDNELKAFVKSLQSKLQVKEIHPDCMIIQTAGKIYRAGYSKTPSGYALDNVKNWEQGTELNYIPTIQKQSLSQIIVDRAKSVVTGLNPIAKNGRTKK